MLLILSLPVFRGTNVKQESVIQISVVNLLSILSNAYNFVFFAVPNEGYQLGLADRNAGRAPTGKDHARMTLLKKMGLTPGVSDLVILAGGRAYCMEVKTTEGEQSRAQRTFERRCHEIGVPYQIVRSVEEARYWLMKWGIVE